MRRTPIIALLALSACGSEVVLDTPPLQRLYFPTGIVHVDDPSAATEGWLYVASSDFDKRWDFGSVSALNLSAYALPKLGERPASPVQIEQLNLDPKQQVYVSPFAGPMARYDVEGGGTRLFLPSREEGDYLFAIEANGQDLSCYGAPDAELRNCVDASPMSLTAAAIAGEPGYTDGKPRAPAPYSVAIDQSSGEMMVTHIDLADSPAGSNENRTAFVVQTNANTPALSPDDFIAIGNQPANSVALGSRFAYLSGRFATRDSNVPAVRMVDRLDSSVVLEAGIEGAYPVQQARGVTVFPDPAAAGATNAVVENRLFLLGRSPDVLLVVGIEGAQTDAPQLRLLRSIPLPAGPNQIRIIPREAGRRALLAITCTDADSVALYDDETGTLATVVGGVGSQPFDIAVRTEQIGTSTAARLYVTNFNDGRVAVIDVTDVNAPYEAYVVAHLGPSQTCLMSNDADEACTEVDQ